MCWVSFQTLNLTDPHTFRDLSKPMGAQTVERKHKFIQRFNEVEKSEEGECFRRLMDNRGLSPLRTPKNFAELWLGETPCQGEPLLLLYTNCVTIQREMPLWKKCKFCLMCLVLLHSVLFPWTGQKAAAESNVPWKNCAVSKAAHIGLIC